VCVVRDDVVVARRRAQDTEGAVPHGSVGFVIWIEIKRLGDAERVDAGGGE